jgi:hypothetical protein
MPSPNHPADYWRPLDDGRVECELSGFVDMDTKGFNPPETGGFSRRNLTRGA